MLRKPLVILIASLLFAAQPQSASAFWVWSPETGKWSNPKNEAKDTPEEQFRFAAAFYQEKDYKRAEEEFQKLTLAFPNTKWAAEGQYFLGLCYEAIGDIGRASDAFRVLVDRYPYSERVNDAIEHEFELAEGMHIMPAVDTAVQLYRHIVKAAPYGPYGAKAQFRMGEAHTRLGELDQAERAFQAVIDNYPNTEFAPKAKYQIARVTYRASQEQEYHLSAADNAIESFEGFKSAYPESELGLEANEAISELRRKKAESFYQTAVFYKDRRKFKSARVYLDDIVRYYPDTPTAELARQRLSEIESAESGQAAPKAGGKPWWKVF